MWYDELEVVANSIPYKTIRVSNQRGDRRDLRVYSFPVFNDALVNAGVAIDTWQDMDAATFRAVLQFNAVAYQYMSEILNALFFEYSRTDVYDLYWYQDGNDDIRTEYSGYMDAVNGGYTAIILHDLS